MKSLVAPSSLERRAILRVAAATILIKDLATSQAWAGGRLDDLNRWAVELAALNAEVHAGHLSPAGWLQQVEAMTRRLPLSELAAYIDLDQATRDFSYAAAFPNFANITLPAEIVRSTGGWATQVIGVRRGAHALPHVHNHWVEAVSSYQVDFVCEPMTAFATTTIE
jgi:hypothetical protein